MSGPAVTATSIGAANPVLWRPRRGQLRQALGGVPGPGGVPSHTQSLADPAACCDVVEHYSPTVDSDRRARILSCRRTYHLRGCAGGAIAVQAATQAAMLPPLTIPPPAYVAPRPEGAPARQSRSYSQATAASNRNEIWIPYSPSTIGSYSPYPHIRPPEMCFECNVPHSHAGNECPARFARIFGFEFC